MHSFSKKNLPQQANLEDSNHTAAVSSYNKNDMRTALHFFREEERSITRKISQQFDKPNLDLKERLGRCYVHQVCCLLYLKEYSKARLFCREHIPLLIAYKVNFKALEHLLHLACREEDVSIAITILPNRRPSTAVAAQACKNATVDTKEFNSFWQSKPNVDAKLENNITLKILDHYHSLIKQLMTLPDSDYKWRCLRNIYLDIAAIYLDKIACGLEIIRPNQFSLIEHADLMNKMAKFADSKLQQYISGEDYQRVSEMMSQAAHIQSSISLRVTVQTETAVSGIPGFTP